MDWYYFSFIAAFLSALAAIIEKKTLFKEKALTFTVILSIFNLILASIFFFFVDFSKISYSTLIIVFFKSILNAMAFLCVMYSIKNLELSDALPMLVLTPGFVAVFALIFLGETLTLIEWIGLILLIAGIYILQIKEIKIGDSIKKLFKSKGHKYVLTALILFTITSLLDRYILNQIKLEPTAYMGFQHLFFAIIFIIIFFLLNRKIKELGKTLKQSWFLILLLSIVTIGYRFFEIMSIKLTSSVALAIAIKRISVFFAVVIGGSLFKEHNLLRKAIATSLLIAGVLMIIRF